MIKLKNFFICVFAGLLIFGWNGVFAQQPAISILVIATFDYPGTGNSTTAHSLNSHGDIVGTYVDSGGVTRGFVRLSNGSFSPPIVEPDTLATLPSQ